MLEPNRTQYLPRIKKSKIIIEIYWIKATKIQSIYYVLFHCLHMHCPEGLEIIQSRSWGRPMFLKSKLHKESLDQDLQFCEVSRNSFSNKC